MQLTQHFNLAEFRVSATATRHGIEIPEPPQAITDNLLWLCMQVLEPLRTALDRPVVVLSGWRPREVNELVGGSLNSQHLTGQAADIVVPGVSVAEICWWLIGHNRQFDQLIDEFGCWVHVSVPSDGKDPRVSVLTARKINRRTKYTIGIATEPISWLAEDA